MKQVFSPGEAIQVVDQEASWWDADIGSRVDVESLTIEDVRRRPLRKEWS